MEETPEEIELAHALGRRSYCWHYYIDVQNKVYFANAGIILGGIGSSLSLMGTHSEYLLPSLAILVIAVGCRWYLQPEYRDASIQLYNAEARVRFLSNQELEGKQ